MNNVKRQKDKTLKEELPRSVDSQCGTGEAWRNSFRKNEEAEPKQKQCPVVDVTGDGSKGSCYKEQYYIGTWNVRVMLLLLLLSCFSRVRLCATRKMAAHQAPSSLGSSRQEHWSGLPFPSPMSESEKWKSSRSVVSNSLWPHGLQPTRLLGPWDFPGKSTGVGCQCLLRLESWIKVNFQWLNRWWQEWISTFLESVN